jgi:hypothetical protein
MVNALLGLSKGWTNHSAVRMWRGYHGALVRYGVLICREWIRRGYQDTCAAKLLALAGVVHESRIRQEYPPWLYREDVQISHRSNLIRKLPSHYAPLWPCVPKDLPYVWPA